MKLPDDIPVWGDVSYRGSCPPEVIEQVSFFSKLRREYPSSYGVIAIHPRNEAQLQGGQFSAVQQHKAEGLSPGASDIVIPARVPFVCEMKRLDHTKSTWQPGQLPYLRACQASGAYSCIALGAKAAWDAFLWWVGEYGDGG